MRFDGRQTFVYAILKHSALFNAIKLLNLFHHNTKIPERNILCSITTKINNSRYVKNARDAHIAFGANPALRWLNFGDRGPSGVNRV